MKGLLKAGTTEVPLVDETFQAYDDAEDLDGKSDEYILWDVVLEAGWGAPGVCAVTQATLGGVASKWLRMYKTLAMDKYMRVWGEFDTASPNTPGASPNDYKVGCDIYIAENRGFIELTESVAGTYPPTRRVGVYFKNDGTITSDIGGAGGTNIKWSSVNGTWSTSTLYHAGIWITAAGTYKVCLDYDQESPTWSDTVMNAGGDWAATMKSIWFLGSGSWQHDFYVDNIDASWTTSDFTTDGEVRGTFPVISSTRFNGYKVEFDATIPDDTTSPLEVRLSENGKTSTADVRIRLKFNQDHSVTFIDNTGNVGKTGFSFTPGIEERWAIETVSKTHFRVGKLITGGTPYWAWTVFLAGRNEWSAGVKYFIALTDNTTGVKLDDITYSW